jgi:hypothetical protein
VLLSEDLRLIKMGTRTIISRATVTDSSTNVKPACRCFVDVIIRGGSA